MSGEHQRASGFTLVEVLVALVVTSLLLTVLMNGAVSARSRSTQAAERRQAVALAASLVEAVGPADLTGPLLSNGNDGALRWTMERAEVAVEPRRLIGLYAWRVTVFGREDRRLVSVATRRLLAAPRP